MQTLDFKPLTDSEKRRLMSALQENVSNDKAIMMDKTTTFAGTADEVKDDEVISAIKSIPCHY